MPNAVLLPPAIALPEELALALATGSPLVVMVSLEGCPFCKIVRESYLVPMRQEQGLPVVQVDMRSQRGCGCGCGRCGRFNCANQQGIAAAAA